MAELAISGVDLSPYSVRGIQQTLEPLQESMSFMRTVNGTLIGLAAPQFQKFKSTVRCTDQMAPGLSGVWPGLAVTVDCVVPLSGAPVRPVVEQWVDGGVTFYYPRLEMMVMGYSLQQDKWGASHGWSLSLEEV